MAQFTLYSHAGGVRFFPPLSLAYLLPRSKVEANPECIVLQPNGWTVAFLLKALGLTYDTKYLDFGSNEQKAAEFTK